MSNLEKITIGVRESKLALAQSDIFLREANKIDEIKNNYSFEVKTFKTKGDIFNTHRLDQIGGKGLFIKEIEEQIIAGNVDIGIHSLKDLPAFGEFSDLEISCWLKRNDTHDALISNSGKGILELPAGSVIGTSSIRRRAQVLNLRTDLKIKLLRGNVDTRLKKLKDGQYDAIILSLAGMQRLNVDDLITEVLPFENFLPAACQGAIGIQSKKNSMNKKIFSKLNHSETQIVCSAEREVLKVIKANCNSPVSVQAVLKKDEFKISCELFDHHGKLLFKDDKFGTTKDYLDVSQSLGKLIIETVGQNKINKLDKIENDFDYSPE